MSVVTYHRLNGPGLGDFLCCQCMKLAIVELCHYSYVHGLRGEGQVIFF